MKKRSLYAVLSLMTAAAMGLNATEADMKKPVKVFILLGQSNMVGMGNISGDKGESL
jgi:hypothetical protein